MQRIGRTNMPAYRIIVAEHSEGPKTGNIVEKVGVYNPKTKEQKLDGDRIKYWISVGAKASGTVHNMLVTKGIIEGKKVNVLPKKHPPVKEGETQTETATEAAAPAQSASVEQESSVEETVEAENKSA